MVVKVVSAEGQTLDRIPSERYSTDEEADLISPLFSRNRWKPGGYTAVGDFGDEESTPFLHLFLDLMTL